MYKVTTVFTRPSADVPFYLETQLQLRRDFANFVSNEPSILLLNTVDETSTRQVVEAFYADEPAYQQFMEKFNTAFPDFFSNRDNYHSSIGVVTLREFTEI